MEYLNIQTNAGWYTERLKLFAFEYKIQNKNMRHILPTYWVDNINNFFIWHHVSRIFYNINLFVCEPAKSLQFNIILTKDAEKDH